VPPVTSLPGRALEKIKLVIKNKSYIFAVEFSEYFFFLKSITGSRPLGKTFNAL